jgi:hypothetical protein
LQSEPHFEQADVLTFKVPRETLKLTLLLACLESNSLTATEFSVYSKTPYQLQTLFFVQFVFINLTRRWLTDAVN